MAKGKAPRGLRPDEVALWQKVKQTATPLRPEKLPAEIKDSPSPPDPPQRIETDLRDFRIGRLAPAARPVQNDTAQKPAPLAMDARTFARMKKGKLGIEARLDLHGMTLDQANSALARFIHQAHASGKRLVLVITGKGHDDPHGPFALEQRGALRRQVPLWLTSGPLRSIVLQISQAHRSHGGSGAYYIYLRRKG